MAARIAGAGWPARLVRGRERCARVAVGFSTAPAAQVVRATCGWTDTDFDLLLAAAHWFQQNPSSSLSPRQVPIEGLHSKWLGSHRPVVAMLAGLDDLGLVEPRSTAVEFTYLDPAHLAAGGRRHDSVIPADSMRPAYSPQLVVIAENKDTAIMFPQVPAAVAVQGGGKSGPAFIAQIEWMRDADRVVYWGDLDADGFDIVNSYRANGVAVETILMDLATVTAYRQFASALDVKSQPLCRSLPRVLPHLTDSEQAAYQAITDPNGGWPIRIEQERIPLAEALAALRTAAST